jgi:hypothetical protein
MDEEEYNDQDPNDLLPGDNGYAEANADDLNQDDYVGALMAEGFDDPNEYGNENEADVAGDEITHYDNYGDEI